MLRGACRSPRQPQGQPCTAAFTNCSEDHEAIVRPDDEMPRTNLATPPVTSCRVDHDL